MRMRMVLGAAGSSWGLLLLLGWVLLPGLLSGFNIDVRRPRLFRGPAGSEFGYRVLQWASRGHGWLLVGAPWDGHRQGDVYRCPVAPGNATCAKANLGSALPWLSRQPQPHLGMTLADSGDGGLVVCAPLWSQPCGTSAFSTGICSRLDPELRPLQTLAPAAQRCSTYMDIVIVLDGSNSIYPWHEVQSFLSNILSKFFIGPGQIQVGVLQYGERAVQEWALGRYQTVQEVVQAARNISRQEGRETRTALAIHRACTEAFSAARGGRAGARRLLLVVTDGESHDGEQLPRALAECERRNITRYAIAVLGHYLRRQQDPEDFVREIRAIASDPDEKFFFNVSDEAALGDIVDALGDRIFSLEGTQGSNESSFELEMSQVGFSLHLLEDGILFGTVGAYGWDGAVLELSSRGRIVPPRAALAPEFPLEMKNHAAYLGYSVTSLRLPGGRRLLASGAPRFQHKGKVLIFRMASDGSIAVAQALTGEQLGSYFGSELCALDVDGDGDTELLLVAAPMYLGEHSRELGRVYLYRVGQGPQGALLTPAGSLGPEGRLQDSRFGYALAAAGDLNQDGLRDLVVGAPLEDGHRGALYVYHGAPGTLLTPHKQRVAALALGSSLRYFGRSLDARRDLDGDGLLELAVGAQGAAVLLRSRLVVELSTSLLVEPRTISVVQRSCRRGGADAVCLRGRACFRASPRARAPRDRAIELLLNVSLEEKSSAPRAAFDSGGRRLQQQLLELPLGRQRCLSLPFHVLDTSDYLRPLSLSLSWATAKASGPLLDEASPSSIRRLIPFSKGCGEDDLCLTDLVLKATMDLRGTRQRPEVLRRGRRKLLLEVALENRKENSYNTSLLLSSSPNLHFSSLALQAPSPLKLECRALGGQRQLCSVGSPVLPSMAKVSFSLELEFSCSVLLDRAEVTLEATSASTEAAPEDNVVQLSSPLRYQPELFLSSASNLLRYEVQPRGSFGPGPQFKTTVKVQHFGCYPARNLSLRMALPSLGYQQLPFLSVSGLLAPNATCTLQAPGAAEVAPVHPEDLLQVESLDCANSWCQQLSCQLGRLERGGEVSIQLLRTIHDDFFRGAKFRSLKVVTRLWLEVPRGSVVVLEEGAQRREVVLEVLQARQVPLSLWILVGSILGGLLLLALIIFCLWKLGFFTRKKLPEEEEEEEEEKKEEQ